MNADVAPEKQIKLAWGPGSLSGLYAIVEEIAAKDLNNLYRTSCFFADPNRYKSFCAVYAVMRIVDDRIDEILARNDVSDEELVREHAVLEAWHRCVSSCLSGLEPEEHDLLGSDHPQIKEILTTFTESSNLFPVPATLWDNFFEAMRWDLEGRGFGTFAEFVEYTEGASVAPTTIYLYLIVAAQQSDGNTYQPPPQFDLIRCGRDLGLFAYLGHILRDLAYDISTGENGLFYLTDEDMAAHGVFKESLLSDLESGSSGSGLQALVHDLVERARISAKNGRAGFQVLGGQLDPDCAFILEMIVGMYERVLDKIASCSYDVMSGKHKLTDLEKMQIAVETAESLGLKLHVG